MSLPRLLAAVASLNLLVACAAPPPAGTSSAPASTAGTVSSAVPTQVFIALSTGRCELEEAGRLAKADQVDATRLVIGGTQSESEPQVLRCVVSVKDAAIKSRLGTCHLTGFSASAPYFFRGDMKTLARSCSVRMLADTTLAFEASGISGDLCSWSCWVR